MDKINLDDSKPLMPQLLAAAEAELPNVIIEKLQAKLADAHDRLRLAEERDQRRADILQKIGKATGCFGELISESVVRVVKERDEAVEKLNWQNHVNKRTAVESGYEFYINEEWTGIRDAAMDEDPGFRASLMKVRYDPDDDRVRIRRVLDDDRLIGERDAARAALNEIAECAVSLCENPAAEMRRIALAALPAKEASDDQH